MPSTANQSALVAQQMKDDERFVEAKKRIMDVVAEYAAKLTEIKQPNPELTADFQKLLDDFGSIRGC